MTEHDDLSVVLEVHFYDGGLQSRLFPSVPRPAWISEKETASLPSDVQLEPKQGLFAFARSIASSSEVVTRFGWYEGAEDRQFGARGNYAATIIWLKGCCLFDLENILGKMRLATGQLAKSGLDAQLEQRLAKFLELIRTTTRARSAIPAFFTGLTPDYDAHSSHTVANFVIYEPDDQVAPKVVQACADLQFANQPFVQSSLVFILQEASHANVGGLGGLPDNFEVSPQLAERLPAVLDTQEDLIKSLEETTNRLTLEKQSLAKQFRDVQVQIEHNRAESSAQIGRLTRDKQQLAHECSVLRDDLSQHRDINDRVAQQVIDRLEKKFRQLETQIVNSLEQNEKRSSYKQPASPGRDSKPKKEIKLRNSQSIFIGIVITLALALTLALLSLLF